MEFPKRNELIAASVLTLAIGAAAISANNAEPLSPIPVESDRYGIRLIPDENHDKNIIATDLVTRDTYDKGVVTHISDMGIDGIGILKVFCNGKTFVETLGSGSIHMNEDSDYCPGSKIKKWIPEPDTFFGEYRIVDNKIPR